jgi:hypothetical protein
MTGVEKISSELFFTESGSLSESVSPDIDDTMKKIGNVEGLMKMEV